MDETLPLSAAMATVAAYKKMTELPLYQHAQALFFGLEQKDGDPPRLLSHYTDLFCSLASEGYSSLGQWFWDQLRYGEFPYGELVSSGGQNQPLQEAARQDIETFMRLSAYPCQRLKERMNQRFSSPWSEAAAALPEWETAVPFSFQSITDFYRESGSGMFARYRAFVWNNRALTPVPQPDRPEPEDLIGYRLQREQVEENTRTLLNGRRVNNILLYGDSGTGKSATVKSLLSIPGFEQLRLIEVQKNQLDTMPHLMRTLQNKKQKFILFLDDLTFEANDNTPSILKSILEGGLELRPINTAIYATSNRRHLVREFFSERGREDEITADESIEEKTALSERFGIRIPYPSLTQAEYLELAEKLAEKSGLKLPKEKLHPLALRWELYHPGRTPRTARQFITGLAASEHAML